MIRIVFLLGLIGSLPACGGSDKNQEDTMGSKGKWTTIAEGPEHRVHHQMFLHGGKIFVVGGDPESRSKLDQISKIEIFDTTANSWAQSDANDYLQACTHIHKERVFQVGKMLYAPCVATTMLTFNMETLEFAEVAYSNDVGKAFSMVISIGDKLYFVENSDERRTGTYDTTNNNWEALPPLAEDVVGQDLNPRLFIWTGEKLVGFGGQDADGEYFEQIVKITPATAVIEKVDLPEEFSSRNDTNPVWTGDKMLVWGGRKSTKYFKDGIVFDPATDEFEGIAEGAGMVARSSHLATWFDGALFIWGGYQQKSEGADGSVALTGLVWQMESKSWSMTSEDNDPNGKLSAALVVSGEKVYVWGGQYSSAQNSQEGAYFEID